MKRRQPQKTVAEWVEELATGYARPFEANGRTYAGDIFYDNLTRQIKDTATFLAVCRALTARGFWLHT